MARTVRDAKIETREARGKLAIRGKPYWRAIAQGQHIGYRRGKFGGQWCARQFTDQGRYLENTLARADDASDADGVAVLSYKQALERARGWFIEQARKAEGLEPVETGPYTVSDATKDYLAHYEAEGKAFAGTEFTIRAHIRPALGDIEVKKLTTKKIRDWHRALATTAPRVRARAGQVAKRKEAKPDAESIRRRRATANRVLTVLKAALNHAWREGKVVSDYAWRTVKPFRNVDAPVVRYLTEAECVRLVNSSEKAFQPLVRAALLTGCRYGELVALKVSDFNPDAGTVSIRTSKSGKARHVVLTNEGSALFEAMTAGRTGSQLIFSRKDGKPWGKSHQQRPLAAACKKAKISPEISFHVLRHTHGSTLAMRSVPMPVIARQLGHADTRMTEKHYAHLSPNYVADTIRQFFPKLGILETSKVKALKPKAVG